ncbi:ABC-type amino acid transport substrate-binding protein [Oceanospirillum multiglobuliferum]|uniref:Solute-binding protein family 3/N-terminal domain-containing protein n=1 Tax=Oceanospirillum multiglobuliferum TaxID=64969 RepID=A0A1T4MX55_9GAMM|nr:ABC transporter substrate-binding protein [Oceanospirillum multiglobuliferum]OPX56861.1 hypothetical protein BTE48_00025 [Oceanospirillum multiglobuliferum]SJZ71367.1 ABC-type amino acid transport substrate-binding protein [Oceanospirillum multiglobuliferum]
MKLKVTSFLSVFLLLSVVVSSFANADSLSEREQNIARAGKLKVCIWPEYFSISYRNAKSGLLEGIDIDLSKEFAKDLGVEVEYVQTHFGIFMNDLEQDKCDVAMFGVGRTESRMERIDFSQPYLSSGMYGITSKAHPLLSSWEEMDQEGIVVCVQKGTYMENAMKASLKKAKLLTVVKPSQREIEVRSGRADLFITDYPYGQKMITNYDWAKLLTPKIATAQFQYAYAVKKGQPEWLARVDQFVAAIKKDGRLQQAAESNKLLPIVLAN